MTTDKSVLVTGADGFVGKNLCVRLAEAGYAKVFKAGRNTPRDVLAEALTQADVIFHLAGANRPADDSEFMMVNHDFTASLVDVLGQTNQRPLVILASSVKAVEQTAYGRSKKAAENVLTAFAEDKGNVAIYRLPNIFGKWCRPNYNSAVATFCHNVARDIEIQINDPAAPIDLIYIDDLIDQWLAAVSGHFSVGGLIETDNVYSTTVGEVAGIIRGFRADRDAQMIDSVGSGLTRALYATYVSYLPTDAFSYEIPAYADPRGTFSEMLKTRNSGQFSYFTAHPGITRGGHYHHTKTEKFLIVHGQALFRFRHILTDEAHEIRVSGSKPVVVETIPGWAHDVTNVGDDIMVSLLWANEIFDRSRPDTISAGI